MPRSSEPIFRRRFSFQTDLACIRCRAQAGAAVSSEGQEHRHAGSTSSGSRCSGSRLPKASGQAKMTPIRQFLRVLRTRQDIQTVYGVVDRRYGAEQIAVSRFKRVSNTAAKSAYE